MARIMVIDDDAEYAEEIAAMVKKAGHSASILNSTWKAVAALEKDTPDLLILDVVFPEHPAGGFDLARKIRRSRALRRLPILLLTSINKQFPMDFSSEDIDDDWMPVQDFVEKPVAAAALTEKICKLLGRDGKRNGAAD